MLLLKSDLLIHVHGKFKMRIWRTMGLSIPMRSLRSRMLTLRTSTTTPKVLIYSAIELCFWKERLCVRRVSLCVCEV